MARIEPRLELPTSDAPAADAPLSEDELLLQIARLAYDNALGIIAKIQRKQALRALIKSLHGNRAVPQSKSWRVGALNGIQSPEEAAVSEEDVEADSLRRMYQVVDHLKVVLAKRHWDR